MANLVEQAGKRRRLIHLVNYNARSTPTISSVRVTCAVPNGRVPEDVILCDVECDSPRALSFNPRPSSVSFTILEVKTYAVIAVSW